jgi:HAE1 family hydrophobic/amphiphilic exporter-1
MRQFGRWFDDRFDRLCNRYRTAVRGALRHRLVVTVVALGCLGLSVAIVQGGVLATTFVPREDNGIITVNASLPPGTPLSGDRSVLASFARRLGRLPAVDNVFVAAGYASGTGASTNLGQVTLDLGPRGARPPIETYLARIRQLARRDYPGLTARAHVQNPFVASGARAASITVLGPSLPELDRLALAIAGRAQRDPAVSQVSTSVPLSSPQLSVVVSQAQAVYLGVSTAALGATIAAVLGATPVPPLVVSSAAPVEPVSLVVNGGRALTPAELAAIPVAAAHGVVPLSSVARLVATTGPAKITQIDREDAVTISASSPSGNSGPALAALRGAARAVARPTGYSVIVGGEALQQQAAFGPLLGALELSLVLIYMLLAALYESFADPLAVICAVPLATVGALGGLWAAGLPISIFALLAMIMLIGIVSKNAILLVDYAKTLRQRGSSRDDAIVEAGATRLRPILMTTATMVAAMVPLAFGGGIGASQRMPVGTVLISGLLSSTLLTLLVVPVLLSLIDDARRTVRRLIATHRAPATGHRSIEKRLPSAPVPHPHPPLP